jgi:hypothetical protein
LCTFVLSARTHNTTPSTHRRSSVSYTMFEALFDFWTGCRGLIEARRRCRTRASAPNLRGENCRGLIEATRGCRPGSPTWRLRGAFAAASLKPLAPDRRKIRWEMISAARSPRPH